VGAPLFAANVKYFVAYEKYQSVKYVKIHIFCNFARRLQKRVPCKLQMGIIAMKNQ
jgi:hypothetical protein